MDWIIARLREPTTYGGLTTLLGVIGVTLNPELQDAIIGVCVSVGGLLMVIMREKGRD